MDRFIPEWWDDKPRREKYFQIGTYVLLGLFFTLLILFIILFATKHESSSSFLLTGTSSSSPEAIRAEINSRLSKKFHVNDLKVSFSNGQFTAVFSLRDQKKTTDVEKCVLAMSSTIVGLPTLTDGSDNTVACSAFLPPATEIQTSTDIFIPTSTTSSSFYCSDNNLKRDIVIVVDFLSVEDDRYNPLLQLQAKMNSSFNFGPTRIFLMGMDSFGAVNVSTQFADTAEEFNGDWAMMMTKNMDNGMPTVATDGVFSAIRALPFREDTPRAVFILASHRMDPIAISENQLAQRGYFVAIAKATLYDIIPGLGTMVSTGIMDFNSWASLADYDPFSYFTCQFVFTENVVVSPAESFSFLISDKESENSTVPSENSCETVDIIFIFDTSYAPFFMEDWKNFAVSFAGRFSLSTAVVDEDNSKLGIIQYSGGKNATLISSLAWTTLEKFNETVRGLPDNQGGAVFLADALQKASDQFLQNGDPSHGKFIVLMTGKSSPADSAEFKNSAAIGQNLTAQGIDIFFVGNGLVSNETFYDLVKINGNGDWCFNSTAEADQTLPAIVLDLFPCPPIACSIAYFAIEATESGNSAPQVQMSLLVTQQIIDQVASLNNGTMYRIMLYNDQQRFFPASGVATFDEIQKMLKNLIENRTYETFISGYTTLDEAFDALSRDISLQSLRNGNLFQSSVLFLGEANFYPLTANKNKTYDQNLNTTLANAGNNLEEQTSEVYVLDSSGSPLLFGEDLWPFAVDQNKIFAFNSSFLSALNSSDYFKNIAKMSCDPPVLARCDYNFLDVAVVLDVVGDPSWLKNYLNTTISLFDLSYASHFSMFTMGLGQEAQLLMPLGNYSSTQDFLSQSISQYSAWRAASLTITTTDTVHTTATTAGATVLTTTVPRTTTTTTEETATAPKTTSKVTTSEATSTAATATEEIPPNDFSEKTRSSKTLPFFPIGTESKNQEISRDEAAYPMTAAIIQSLFSSLKSQFGCPYSNSNKADRIMAPNVVLLISDNFQSYTEMVMSQFSASINADWKCNDCPGKPLLYFLAYESVPPSHGLGQFVIQPFDVVDKNSVPNNPLAVKSINKMITTVCKTALPVCSTYVNGTMCTESPMFN